MPTVAAGTLLANRYSIETILGQGQFGEVWKAFDTHRGMYVALKLLRDRDPNGAWHEARVLTALRSPISSK